MLVKKLIFFIILYFSAIYATNDEPIEHIEIDNLLFSIVHKSKSLIICNYADSSKLIARKYLMEEGKKSTNSIYYEGKELGLVYESIVDILNQEKKVNFNDTKFDCGVTYSKNSKYTFIKNSFSYKESINYLKNFDVIKDISTKDEMKFLIGWKYFYSFGDNGRIKEISYDSSRFICKYIQRILFEEFYQELDRIIQNKNEKEKKEYIEKDLEKYIRDHNYILKEKEIVNGKEIDTLIMKFNKEYEVEVITMVKIDYLDNTINGSITWKFEKGKIISEERNK